MGFGRLIIVGFVGVMSSLAMICSCECREFHVEWVLKNPNSETFNHWAERNRFQVNDTLSFKYKNETDSVLVVSKEDYFSCNTKNPVIFLKQDHNNGESIFKFGHSGPFYFISGNADSCLKGQKLIVVVLALTHNMHDHQHAQPPHSSPSPVSQSQTPTAESPEKSGVDTTTAPVPAPAKNSASGQGGVEFRMINVVIVLLGSFLVGLF